MNTLVLLSLIWFACLSASHSVNPTMRCMTEPKSVKSALKKSAAVFSGEVLEIKNGPNFMEARFRVERSWKGVEAEEVTVLTYSINAESPHYRLGEKYLVFAVIQNGKLFTGNCSRTKRIADAKGDLQQLGEGKSSKDKRSNSV
jgi:hypothetical protein